jgi:hypothetical protein
VQSHPGENVRAGDSDVTHQDRVHLHRVASPLLFSARRGLHSLTGTSSVARVAVTQLRAANVDIDDHDGLAEARRQLLPHDLVSAVRHRANDAAFGSSRRRGRGGRRDHGGEPLKATISEIEKQYGKGAIMRLGEGAMPLHRPPVGLSCVQSALRSPLAGLRESQQAEHRGNPTCPQLRSWGYMGAGRSRPEVVANLCIRTRRGLASARPGSAEVS